jgi:hypothetical protein
MANSQLWNGVAVFDQINSTPFKFYNNDFQFRQDAVKVADFCAKRLGYPSMDVEMGAEQFFTCFESAITTYGNELYLYQIRNNFLSLENSPNNQVLNNAVIKPNLANIIRLAQDYGTEAEVGGTVTLYKGSLDLIPNQQEYDLNEWANQNLDLQHGDSIEIRKVYYQNAPAIVRYFDPYAGTGYGSQQLLDAFGFGNYSPAINFMLMPLSYDMGVMQAIELNDEVRKSAFSFSIVNNKIQIFPIPSSIKKLYFEYYIQSEKNSPVSNPDTLGGLVTDISNVPYQNPVYSKINAPGRYWIFEYALALASENLGLIRGKYSTVPIPGAETTLNQADLLSKGKESQLALIEKLRLDLDEASRRMQLMRKAEENENMQKVLNNVPIPIYIG